MEFSKAFCLLSLAQSVCGETTVDYNIYNSFTEATTPDYNIYNDVNSRASLPNEGFIILPKPFEETNPDRVEAGELFDKDMLLTEAQWRDLALRKGLAYEFSRWPEGGDGFPRVPYRFADDAVNQAAVRAGIAHWEQHTCIRFELITNINQPHLKFQKKGGCWSYVGYISQYTTGEDISIDSGCTSLGIVVHEIGHAIGFYHEQSRPDRNDSIHVNEENIIYGKGSNFDRKTPYHVDSKGIPYDYSSVMHYGGFGFSKNGHLTIATVDPRNQELIGRRSGLSHRDMHLANLMYRCIDKWLQACGVISDPCQNGGYTGANCTCVCPQGTSGSSCDTVEQDYFASQRSNCSMLITSPGTITSPNYPNYYPYGLTCAKWILAPECSLPRVTFSAFRLSDCWDKLEIRTNNRYDGNYYCGTSIAPGTSFTATTNELILMFYTRSNYETGWSADVTFVDDPNCSPGYTQTQTTPPTQTTTTLPPTTQAPTTLPPTTQTPTTLPPTTQSSTTLPPTTQASTTLSPTTQAPTTLPPTTQAPTTLQPAPNCSILSTSDGVTWLSPHFGSENYPNNFTCGLTGHADSPYMTGFKINTLQLQRKKHKRCVDFIEIQIPYSRTIKLCGTKKRTVLVPNRNLNISFVTDNSITDVGFNISITWQKSKCHRIIELTDNSAMDVIESPRFPKKYTKHKVCEWWIVAPEGKRIQLEFTRISLRDRNCLNSYIAIDKSGQATYWRENSSLLCAGQRTATVVSSGRVMNVAFAGGRRRSWGFSAQYTVV
ncbi:blastula protease 10-like isoform X2 [Penaeus monodon]|uniref:blastula protease 10-like isoform X2 n=1 Tax=Penaeus monodon TaxID=6687 RepID=UPI0018A7A1B1|nr:blastula protease 10-like isoform X2 [Penaeus monodon]